MNFRCTFAILAILCPLSLFGQNNYTRQSFSLKGHVKSIVAKTDSLDLPSFYATSEELKFSKRGKLKEYSTVNLTELSLFELSKVKDSSYANTLNLNDGLVYDSLGYLIFECWLTHGYHQEGEYHLVNASYFIYNELGYKSELRSYHVNGIFGNFESIINRNHPYVVTLYEYEYDLLNNWVSKKSYRGNLLIESISRKIVYFDE